MSDYGATYADVQRRVPLFTIGASTKPSTTDVNAWIDEAEAKINNALKAGGITTPVTNSEGMESLKALSVDYGEAMLRRAHVPAGTAQAGEGDYLLKAFDGVLADMRRDPSGWSAMLHGGASESATDRIYSHVTDDVDGRASSSADFEPTFSKADAGDQF